MKTTLYKVENLVDRATARRLENSIIKLQGVQHVEADQNMHEVSVTHAEDSSIIFIVKQLEKEGCPLVRPFNSTMLFSCVFTPPYPSKN